MERLPQVLLGLTLLLACTAPAAAQSASLKAELLKDWLDLKETMHRLAEAMPEDKYAFKTPPPQRDFGQQVAHIAGANMINLGFLGAKTSPPMVNPTAQFSAGTARGGPVGGPGKHAAPSPALPRFAGEGELVPSLAEGGGGSGRGQ